ncbi:hypothetical protein ACFLXT_05030 [Chloroflexota bacterium]
MRDNAYNTAARKKAFLENLPTFKYITKACSASGIHYKTYSRWLDSDEEFRQQCQQIKTEIQQTLLDEVETELHKRSMDGTSKQSDILLMFEAKSLAPEKYRDNFKDTATLQDNRQINIIVSTEKSKELTERLIRGERKQLEKGTQ